MAYGEVHTKQYEVLIRRHATTHIHTSCTVWYIRIPCVAIPPSRLKSKRSPLSDTCSFDSISAFVFSCKTPKTIVRGRPKAGPTRQSESGAERSDRYLNSEEQAVGSACRLFYFGVGVKCKKQGHPRGIYLGMFVSGQGTLEPSAAQRVWHGKGIVVYLFMM